MSLVFSLREFRPADADSCWRLFLDTIRRVNCQEYTPIQIEAWAHASADPETWCQRFEGKFAYVVEHREAIVGFADMDHDGYLDRLFVSADHQRQGIGARLMDALEATASELQLPRIHTQSSITAKPFFFARGFVVNRAQTVSCRGVELANFAMQMNRD